MTFVFFRRRRRAVHARYVNTLLSNLETLAPAFGLEAGDRAAFARDVFVTMTGAEPDSVLEEVVGAGEASAMEVRLSHAAVTVAALSDFAGTDALT